MLADIPAAIAGLPQPATVAQAFPVVLGEGEELPTALRVTGFGRPVWVLFVDVGTAAREHFAAFFDSITACWIAGPVRSEWH